MTKAITGVRVLFAGQYWPGANTLYIARAFESCGAIVRILNESSIYPAEWWSVAGKLTRKTLKPLIKYEWNKQFLGLIDTFKPDLIYLSNAGFISHKSLQFIRSVGIPVMCFYHDVTWNRPGDDFINKVNMIDLIATTRKWQEPLLYKAGAKAVKVVRFGYDPLVHRPLLVNRNAFKHYGADTTLIATYEKDRRNDLEKLIGNKFKYSFRLWGGYWDRLQNSSLLSKYWQGRNVHEQEIPVIYATSKIAFHWIMKEVNSPDPMFRIGDQHNSRTFQIPACAGAMMLAQRTDEHLKYFKENDEAVYFSDIDELHSKLDYWLDPSNSAKRHELVNAARKRCLDEDYTYNPIVNIYLNHFGLPSEYSPR